MKKKLSSITLLVLMPALLMGCWDRKIFEDVGFTLQIGVELADTGELTITRTTPVVAGEIHRRVELLSSEGDSIRDTREIERRISPKMVEGGKIQQIVFSEDFARKGGIHELLEVFEREPADAVQAFIAVAEGSPKKLLQASLNFEDKPRSAFYLSELLRSNVKRSYSPDTTIYNFNVKYFAPGFDPVAPIIKLDDRGVRIVGTALFSGDMMVGRIEPDKTPMLIAMMNKFNSTEYLLGAPEESISVNRFKRKVAVMLTDVKRRIEIGFQKNKPIVKIELAFEGNIDEDHWTKPIKEGQEKQLEKDLEEKLKADCEDIIKVMQETGSDPIGIGNMIRARHPSSWKKLNWPEDYKAIRITVDTKLNIIHHGVIY